MTVRDDPPKLPGALTDTLVPRFDPSILALLRGARLLPISGVSWLHPHMVGDQGPQGAVAVLRPR